ncbi:GATOR complex protein MIOS [Bactrocera dorsalis]|uniref:GATOR complex protein MIOS n=3 Tax=Bactrocera dorsalis TaxID=27457 RepID=A0A6I9VNK9_BACDO|nr:GATOR complex protein MIOS [Bactrocera dorsalis]
MMSGTIHGLSWFPQFPDKFVTWGQEIKLYERTQHDDNRRSALPNISANFLATETRYQYARCVQPSYHKNRPIIAVGLGDGKVGICDFHETVDNSWEFTPRQQRMCLCLAWNELDHNVLAIGHDRHRSDSCITIWDIERGVPKDSVSFFGHSESAHSMCWDKNHRVLIAGVSQKQIKLFDLKQGNTTCQSIQTKMVHGLAVAPNGNYLCSYLDSVITIWDLRVLDHPLKIIQSGKNHLQLSWCPTRTSLLTSLQRESPFITLYDIRSVDAESSREVYHVKRQLQPFQAKYYTSNKPPLLTSLSWHNTDYERALLLSEQGNILEIRLPLSLLTTYSNHKKLPLLPQRPLAIANSPIRQNSSQSTSSLTSTSILNSALNFEILDHSLSKEDLVEETYQRALADYGLKTDMHVDSLPLTPYLKSVWLTLGNLYREERLTGLKSVLGINLGHTSEALMASSRIESHVLQWPDFINSNNLVCYRSEQRDIALKLCGWVFEQDLERFVNGLCDNKEFSRAAMICVFHLKIVFACDILSKAADLSRNSKDPHDASMFRIAAIALSSFNADRCNSTWRNQRSNANKQIQDAHLRAIFSFLTTENDNFDAVLTEDGISLADRVAFACKYLSESKLSDYVKQLIQKSIENGDLNGLLLTGESLDGINILQAYLDATSDVQTVALIAVNYFHREHFTDNRIQYWISSYLDDLNSWGLWEKRAELDIKIENLRTGKRATRSVYLSCNFCGKSVSNALQEDARMRSATSNVNKLSSCPSCRKPLPRCSLCLLHMGTTLNITLPSDSTHESLGWQSKPFSKWFSWCQTCRHGGHTEHMMQWFKQNSECPVSSCTCRCFDMDGTIPNDITDYS